MERRAHRRAESRRRRCRRRDILVVHRSDGSGTSYVFTDYLSTVSPAWATKPGKGKEVQWPVGLGAKGNEGVAGQVQADAGRHRLRRAGVREPEQAARRAQLKNAAGEFVAPSIASVTAAAAGAASKLPANTDYRVSIVNAPGTGAYPISSFTWILVYQKQTDAGEGEEAGGLPEVGADRRSGDGGTARLRAAAGADAKALDTSSGDSRRARRDEVAGGPERPVHSRWHSSSTGHSTQRASRLRVSASSGPAPPMLDRLPLREEHGVLADVRREVGDALDVAAHVAGTRATG